jgi:hypothetical protein
MHQLSICRLFAWLGMLYLMLGPRTMASAQEPPYSPDCQRIADQIKVLAGEKQSIANDLGEGKVPGKAASVAQVNKLQRENHQEERGVKHLCQGTPVYSPAASQVALQKAS